MRYTVTKQRIQIVGRLWMGGTAAMDKDLSAYDLGNIEDPTDRESVADWLATHSGDFQEVIDFRADFDIGDNHIVHEWEKGEDSEMTYGDCMFPSED